MPQQEVQKVEFEITDKNCIVAVLSCYDLYEMGLSYDEIDYSNEKTRLALGKILSKGKMYADNLDGFLRKLRIDVLPSENDGCVIFFTDLEKDTEKQAEKRNVFFFCKNFDNLLDLSKAAVKTDCETLESSLYKGKDGFYLCIENPSDALNSLCLEFLTLCRDENLFYERIKECCSCLIKSDALHILSGKKREL